jgi:hypothetical protein
MKKQIQLLLLALSLVGTMQAQFNWTWIGGSNNTSNTTPNWGIQGTAAASNNPGSRYLSTTWTDNSGDLWLFGGYQPNYGYMADLWKYTVSTGMWTWMKGPSSTNVAGVYGTQGTGSTNNYPGQRIYSGGWADNSGNLYLFGGYGFASSLNYVYNNDLWKYNISTNTWTWIKGSNTGNAYATTGTQGVGASGNTPGGHHYSPITKDKDGNGWLMYGYGYNASTVGLLNDVWKFDVTTGNWIFITGSSTSANIYGTSATQNVPSTSIRPGGRYTTSLSYDLNGNIYFFGGDGQNMNNYGWQNDFWKFNPSTNEWTWLSGSLNTTYSYGTFGTQGVPSSGNTPGASYQIVSQIIFPDQGGNLWLLPTYGYSSNGSGNGNALWRYNISSNQWTWMKGSNSSSQVGTYGTLNVPSTNNTPGGRENGMAFGTPSALYYYGGYGLNQTSSGYQNDFWRFDICNYAAAPSNSTNITNLSVCSGNTTTLSATTNSGTVNWYTSATSTAAIGTGTNVVISNSLMTSVSSPSLFTFFSASSVTCGENPNRTAVVVTVNPRPTLSVNNATLCQGSIFIMQPSGASNYTYSNGSPTVVATANTVYSVSGTSALGCTSTISAVASLSVLPLPVISATSGSICLGGSYVISASGAATYTYSSGTPSVSPINTSVYMVSGTSSLGCVSASPAIANVVVYPLPTVSANNGTVCSGSSFTIVPQGASTYTISGGANVVTPSSSSIYTITGTNQYGCAATNTAYASVIVNPLPVVTAAGSQICAGQSVTLLAGGAATYTYSGGSNVVTPATTTSYSITGASLAGCKSAVPAVVTITVNAVPVVSVNSGTICAGSSFTITPSGAATYTFINGGPVVNPNTTMSYFVSGTSSAGCVSAANAVATVTVYQSPSIAAQSGMICMGESFSLSPTGAAVYTITGGSANVSPTVTSQYTITGVSAEGCENLTGVVSTVIVNALPVINASAYSPTICAGESATLLATGAGAYNWIGSNGSQMSTVGFIVITPTATTVYTVNGYSQEGCESAAVVVTQNVAACAGIAMNELTSFEVYPNPNNGSFIISAPYSANYSIMNAAGQLIREGQTGTGNTQIDLADYSNGLYFVRIQSNNQTSAIKVIKQ